MDTTCLITSNVMQATISRSAGIRRGVSDIKRSSSSLKLRHLTRLPLHPRQRTVPILHEGVVKVGIRLGGRSQGLVKRAEQGENPGSGAQHPRSLFVPIVLSVGEGCRG